MPYKTLHIIRNCSTWSPNYSPVLIKKGEEAVLFIYITLLYVGTHNWGNHNTEKDNLARMNFFFISYSVYTIRYLQA